MEKVALKLNLVCGGEGARQAKGSVQDEQKLRAR